MDTLTLTTPKAPPAPVGVPEMPEMPWPPTSEQDTRAEGVRHSYRLGTILHKGKGSTLRQATYMENGEERAAIIKMSRAHDGGQALAREAQVLRSLISSKGDMGDLVAPYLPDLIEECDVDGAPCPTSLASVSPPKRVDPFAAIFGNKRGETIGSHPAKAHNALAYNEFSGTVSLKEIRGANADGVDAKDSAWMFRRLLMALGLVHSAGCTHGAINTDHVLILPEEHGLFLWDWTQAKDWSESLARSPGPLDEERSEVLEETREQYRSAACQDLAGAARAMLSVTDLSSMPRRLRSFYKYVATAPSAQLPQALDILDDYNTLIEELWGERRYRLFAMPPVPDKEGQGRADDHLSPRASLAAASTNHNTKRRP